MRKSDKQLSFRDPWRGCPASFVIAIAHSKLPIDMQET
jgi:hypothetical protein